MFYNQMPEFCARSCLALLLLLTAACNNPPVEQIPERFSLSSQPGLSCAIALTPHLGDSGYDLRIGKLQKRLEKNRNDFDLLENLAWAYMDKAQVSFDPGFNKLAGQTAACMNFLQPESSATMLVQARILHSQHRFKEAEKIARQLVELRGYWYDFATLGDVLMEQGALQSAIVAYQEMISQNPGPPAYNRAAYMRWLKGDVEGAIKMLKLSISTPGAINTTNGAWAMTHLAEYALQLGHLENSLNRLATLLLKQPDYAPALLLRGRIYLIQGLVDAALEDFNKALSLNPLPEYRWALIEALSEKNVAQQKLLHIKQQLLNSAEIDDRRTLALYLASTGHASEKAKMLAEQELEQRQDVFSLDVYAWTLRANQQLTLARQYSIQSLKEGTKSARLFYHAGVIAAENQQFEEAKRWLHQAKQLENTLWPSERRHLNQFL